MLCEVPLTKEQQAFATDHHGLVYKLSLIHIFDIRVVGSRTSGGETDYLSLIRKAVEYQNKNQISVSERCV